MKKIKQRAATTFTTDSNGQRLAHVALAGTNQRATLYTEDLERILADGWSPFWSFTITDKTAPRRKYVLVHGYNAKGRHRSITVARLVAEVSKGQRVKYADGDRLNLRRENLLMKKGGAWMPLESLRPNKGTQREHAVPPVPQRPAWEPHVFTADFREGI